ncbi:Bifunctional homocysteine S-methyltransferase/5,10-methylenetetrahydrofolate reductase [Moorella thermoacetica]|uniref:Methylenetetrahydrofolate reductase n=1 Tax=Neomoorella thermoacetica TaxID=1525 RepID=A0AAC9HHS7_NEOTH|nr:methylenetetrahydrofolate reductase [Moorella thermoacetica]AOQ23915.1 Bifunctional homocysteine S-methyltransferase/5,10-methylenetetrahydrofolate reductase [Moorella thermoacetica]TYL14319.1 Bifunctional homocysteine S-methyltransferase/5,10-methylenetetrahydrofolate reductase [Moorella thermoacetica]
MVESKMAKILSQGQFLVSGEIGPPKHADPTEIKKHAALLKDYVDAMNLTDNQTAIVRLSSIAAGVHVLQAGGEPIIQMTVRDRNRIALQSDLLGAYSLGMRNVLCLSGDHQSFGNHPTAKNVHDVDSLQLIRIVKDLRDEKKFACGEEIKGQEPRFFIGAAANPFADPFEFRVMRLEKKINAGADFIQTQCIFDMERFERFMALVRERGLHKRAKIIAGVMPLKSARAAKYMQQSVAGMIVPDEIVNRMEKASDPKAEGVAICVELIKHLQSIEGVAGVHIMAVMWEDIIPTIVKEAGLYPRPKVE